MSVRVNIVFTHHAAKMPWYSKEGDAGADVRVVPRKESYPTEVIADVMRYSPNCVDGTNILFEQGDYIIPPRSTIMADLGFKIELLPGYEMQVRSRSGLAKRGIVVANAPGTIDSGYRGPCMVLLRNENSTPKILKHGTRVAQFVLKRAPQANFVEVDELGTSDRGEGGFGSTGTK